METNETEHIHLEIYYGDTQPVKNYSIEIIHKEPVPKSFIGGFRSQQGIEYHHAVTQTEERMAKKISNKPIVEKYHRDSQTVQIKHSHTQSKREQATQMEKPGLFIDNSEDKIMIVREPYFDSKQLDSLRLDKTIKLQAYYRRWRARCLFAKMKEEKIEKEKQEKLERERREEEEYERRQQEMFRRMHPQSKEDFDILYTELEMWRQRETQRIKSKTNSTEEETKEEFKELIRKEVKLLQTVDRLKIKASKENKKNQITEQLSKMSEPKFVTNLDDTKTFIETPFTIRAKELWDLYEGLNSSTFSVDERLDVLLHVKWSVKEFDCILTRDISDLIDREADLLNRGRSGVLLEGLRTRISNLFLQFINTPEFNPNAVRVQPNHWQQSIRPYLQPVPNKY